VDRRTGDLGDIITGVNGAPAAGWERLQDLVHNMPIGSTLQLEIERGGRTLAVELQIGSV
jgi:S1-C subfamily serine protease